MLVLARKPVERRLNHETPMGELDRPPEYHLMGQHSWRCQARGQRKAAARLKGLDWLMLPAVRWRSQRSIIKVQRALALKWPPPLRLNTDFLLGGLTKEVNRPSRRQNFSGSEGPREIV